MLLLAAANLALSPLVLAWQVLHALQPRRAAAARAGKAGDAPLSRLARLQLRHFNELPHEAARAWPAPTARLPPSCAPPLPRAPAGAAGPPAGLFAGAPWPHC